MIDEYKKASGDVWLFFRKHFKTRDDDEYWEKIFEEATEVVKPYEGTPAEEYARKYVVLCVNELARKHKEMG